MAIKFSLLPTPLFLTPNIQALVKFANGNLGIADQVKLTTIVSNVNNSNSESQLNQFKSLMGFSLANSDDSYYKNGKYKISTTDVILTHSDDLSGLSALEKSLIQSIFESQKPYMEIFIQTVGILVKIEDIIARVLSVGGNSLKPFYNPIALGYGGSLLNSQLSQLESLKNFQRGTSATQSNNSPNPPNTLLSTPDDPPIGYEYKIDSIVYSTGTYDPNVKYTYEYRDILDDSIGLNDLNNNGIDTSIQDQSGPKPKVIVFGIFDSKGRPIDTVPSWLQKSGKWFGQFDMISDIKYIWTKPSLSDKISFASPGKGWKQKKDIDGNPIVSSGTSSDLTSIINYYNDQIQTNLNELNISEQDQVQIKQQINQSLTSGTSSIYQMQMDTLVSSGFLPTLQLTNGTNPIGKYPFLPQKISWSGTSSVGLTSSIIQTWIDPENDYDLKLIEIKPTLSVMFYNSNNQLIQGKIDPLTIKHNLQKNQVEIIVETSNQGTEIEIINISQITNSQLSINTPYSKGVYGSSTNTQKQTIDTLLRYATSPNDKEIYYIIEGILSTQNTQNFPIVENGTTVSGSGYYRVPKGPISAISAFINMIVDIFSKLLPAIEVLENILTDPASFIVESVILRKIGDNYGTENIKFDIFSQGFLNDFNSLLSMDPSLRKSFVANSELRNYVYVAEDNSYKFLLDGLASVEFLNFIFGIDLVNLIPSLSTGGVSGTQPILEFLLNLVTFPLNIIKSIIEYILNFFKSLGNPFSLPSDIVDFISFKWILNFFDPLTLLGILGINFDIIKFGSWISSLDTYPDDHLFDLSEIISMPFMPKLFTVNKTQLLSLEKTPMQLLKAIICLIADIINAFIDFIWDLMGLTPVIPPPHVNLCNDVSNAIANNQIQPASPITGTQSSSLQSQLYPTISQQAYEYIYTITLPDGTVLTGLTYDQLQNYLVQNPNIQFDFNF